MKSKKAFSLSMETVVVLIILLIALILIVMFFTGTGSRMIDTLVGTANTSSSLAQPIGK